MKKVLLSALMASVFSLSSYAAEETLVLQDSDRVLVLVPHPDDEVLGNAGVIQRALAMGLPVRIVFLTVGDANEWSFIAWKGRPVIMPSAARAMGERRSREALAAEKVLGVPAQSVTFLGYPDHGTEAMLLSHWGAGRRPLTANFTRASSVPYSFAFRKGAPYRGDSVLADLESILREFRPTQVFVSHAADHHPDHHALYLYATVALWNLSDMTRPSIHPFLVHFPKWPGTKGLNAEQRLTPPAELAQANWERLLLTPQAVEKKREALTKHATQYHYSASRLLPFVRSNELFGDFPALVLKPAGTSRSIPDDESTFAEAVNLDLMDPADQKPAAEAFVDLETVELRLVNRSLQATLHLDRDLPGPTQAVIYLLGWRKDRKFDEMPKLTLQVGQKDVSLSNNGASVGRRPVQLMRKSRQVQVSIPLSMIGNPERILFGARTATTGLTLDQLPWRVLLIEP